MISFDLQIGRDPGARAVLGVTLAMIELAVALNIQWLKDNPEGKCLLACDGIVYDRVNAFRLSTTIPIKIAPAIAQTGKGLCIDLVALDIAVRRSESENAYPVIEPFEGRPGVYHVFTGVKKGSKERLYDPTGEIAEHGSYVSRPPCHCPA